MKDKLTTIAANMALLLIAGTVIGFLVARFTGAIAFYDIPSGSMEPTLPIGSHIIASRFPYWRHEPQRGDIITLATPADPRITYIKRIIALPGDTVQMRNEIVVLNKIAVPKKRIGDYRFANPRLRTPSLQAARQYRERLPSGVSYKTIELAKNSPIDNTAVFEVPPGHYFVLGDNRDNSSDSRSLSRFGFVPRENIRGKFITINPVFRFIFTLLKATGF